MKFIEKIKDKSNDKMVEYFIKLCEHLYKEHTFKTEKRGVGYYNVVFRKRGYKSLRIGSGNLFCKIEKPILFSIAGVCKNTLFNQKIYFNNGVRYFKDGSGIDVLYYWPVLGKVYKKLISEYKKPPWPGSTLWKDKENLWPRTK